MKKVLVTGGNGFLGEHVVRYLNKLGGVTPIVFDKLKMPGTVTGDICSVRDVEKVFKGFGPFDCVYHLASAMPDKSHSDEETWRISVLGTMTVAKAARSHHVPSFVFTSSNVTYGIPDSLPITEDTPVRPIEIYGKSKVQAETELYKFKDHMSIQIFRCPVITGVGRLGIQAILFEFISESRNVYVLGKGDNKYQFVDADDVAQALEKSSHIQGFDIYNIGGNGVKTLRELYQTIIEYASSTSSIISLPKAPALFILSLLDKMNVSPLGVYQYSMLGLSMYADTGKIKKKLQWKPQKTITESFIENYKWYVAHKGDFTHVGTGVSSSNKSLPKMKLFKLLKYFS